MGVDCAEGGDGGPRAEVALLQRRGGRVHRVTRVDVGGSADIGDPALAGPGGGRGVGAPVNRGQAVQPVGRRAGHGGPAQGHGPR
ncbi:MAG: hypothetical protein ACK559_22305, partial [bacterium]